MVGKADAVETDSLGFLDKLLGSEQTVIGCWKRMCVYIYYQAVLLMGFGPIFGIATKSDTGLIQSQGRAELRLAPPIYTRVTPMRPFKNAAIIIIEG